MFFVPLNSLFQSRLRRHLVSSVPDSIHCGSSLTVSYRAIRYMTQLSTIAEPTNKAQQ